MTSQYEKWGRYYWCVITAKDALMVHADSFELKDGALLFLRKESGDKEQLTTLAFAAGEWKMFYAADVISGDAVAVEHWNRTKKRIQSMAENSERRDYGAR